MRIGMRDLPQKLRDARKRLGLSQAQFAQAIGASQGSVSKWETGKERPSFGAMVDISRITGQPSQYFWAVDDEQGENLIGSPTYPKIVGAIEAIFSETVDWEPGLRETLMVPLPRHLSELEIDCYIVSGNRANRLFAEGDIVFVLSIDRYSFDLVDNDIVLVRRRSEEGLTEISLRRLHYADEIWLWPITDDPTYQEPFVEQPDVEDADYSRIIGVVVANLGTRFRADRLIEPR